MPMPRMLRTSLMPGGYLEANAQLLMQAALHVLEILQALDVFQTLQQALFLLTRQQQDARGRAGQLQQLLAVAGAGAGRAGGADGQRRVHGH